ncbi:MAG: helix-turn-helix transcriptional regulator [Chloroflexi bacterium]|nr:helix-turn-helix transcriptional regulator [Chloroflexota bacterium]
MRTKLRLVRQLARRVGQSIKDGRLANGMTQAELAASVGVESQTVQRWECGARLPSDESFTEMETVLGFSIQEVLLVAFAPRALEGRGLTGRPTKQHSERVAS